MSDAYWEGDSERRKYGYPPGIRRRMRVDKSHLFECRLEFMEAELNSILGIVFGSFSVKNEITVFSDGTTEVLEVIPIYCDGSYAAKELYLNAFNPDNTFNYSLLDGVIFTSKTKDKDNKIQIAMTRLMHPYDLTEEARTAYKKYLGKHAKALAQNAIDTIDLYTNARMSKITFHRHFLDWEQNL